MIKFLYILFSVFAIVTIFSIINFIGFLLNKEQDFISVGLFLYIGEILFFGLLTFIAYSYLRKLKKRKTD